MFPPTSVDGVVYGLNEIRGIARPLTSRRVRDSVSREDALYYHLTVYDVMESDGGGRAYQKVGEEQDQVPICCEDDTGSIPLRLQNAEVSSVKMARRKEDERLIESRRIEPGDELYVLGSASVDFSGEAHLQMTGTDDEFPYIVSNRTEENLKAGFAHSGFFWLGFAMAAMLLASVAGRAYFGLFGPLSLGLSGGFALMPIPL